MRKFFIFLFLLFLFSSKSFAKIVTLDKCYLIKLDGDIIFDDKFWVNAHWDQMNIVDEQVTHFLESKEFIPDEITWKQFAKITNSCINRGGCNKKAKDFLDKYNLYKKYIRNDDYKVSINYGTGTIIDEDILTDDAVKIINHYKKLRFKWGNKLYSDQGIRKKLFLVEKNRYENYKIINYTQDTVFSQSNEYRILNVNIKNNTLYYKIDSETYKQTATYICRNKNNSKNSNSKIKKLLKKFY